MENMSFPGENFHHFPSGGARQGRACCFFNRLGGWMTERWPRKCIFPSKGNVLKGVLWIFGYFPSINFHGKFVGFQGGGLRLTYFCSRTWVKSWGLTTNIFTTSISILGIFFPEKKHHSHPLISSPRDGPSLDSPGGRRQFSPWRLAPRTTSFIGAAFGG